MRTLSVEISDVEYKTFGLSKNRFFFSEIADLIERQIAKQALRHSVDIAEQNGLSTMTMDEINLYCKYDYIYKCSKEKL